MVCILVCVMSGKHFSLAVITNGGLFSDGDKHVGTWLVILIREYNGIYRKKQVHALVDRSSATGTGGRNCGRQNIFFQEDLSLVFSRSDFIVDGMWVRCSLFLTTIRVVMMLPKDRMKNMIAHVRT